MTHNLAQHESVPKEAKSGRTVVFAKKTNNQTRNTAVIFFEEQGFF